MTPIRLTVVATHPAQYFSPWFRFIAASCPEIDLTVLYAARPTPLQQGVGFGRAFEWDTSLIDGYRTVVVRHGSMAERFDSDTFRGLDVPEIGKALLETRPEVVLVPGWHSITLVRAIRAARRARIPVLYRGDTHNGTGPQDWRRPLWNLKTRLLLGQYSGYLSVGTLAREYLVSHGVSPTQIHDSPHCVDNQQMAEWARPHLDPVGRAAAREAFELGPDDFAVLFAGKFLFRKRPVDAVAAVAELGPRAVLVLVGNGRLDSEIRLAAEKRGVRLSMPGFQNQSAIARAYAAADCLVMPSSTESWGLVVNEALATGLPVVVSDRVGCAPDLVSEATGAVVPFGQPAAIAAALAQIRDRGARATMSAACLAAVDRHSFARATAGLVAACESTLRRSPRIIACCGGMVIVSGAERLTFEVLGVARRHGSPVHTIVNSWENHRIVPLARAISASWSIGFYYYGFTLTTRNPFRYLQMVWEIIRTSVGLLRDAWHFQPTLVLLPDHFAGLRNALALPWLRARGIPVVLRMPTVPEPGRAQDFLWRHLLRRLVTTFVPNSEFTRDRVLACGIPPEQVRLIRNRVVARPAARHADTPPVVAGRRRLLIIGQIAPFKGTHFAVDAALALLAEGRDIELLIAGAEPGWPPDLVAFVADLKRRIVDARASERVRFIGLREDVSALMRSSFLLLTPIPIDESFGNVALEALSEGLPVVTFPRGGLLELVDHGRTGYVCTTEDASGLLEGIRHYLEHPDERDRASAAALQDLARPDHPCNPELFDRNWRKIFSGDRPSHAGDSRAGGH